MGDSSGVGDSGAIELTGKIMVVTVLVLFLVVVFVFFIHLYFKWYTRRLQESSPNTATRRRRRFDFAPGYEELNVLAAVRRGLDPSVLKTIPVVLFSDSEFKDGLECAVCLSEVCDGEKIRFLPKCNHGFHVGCIDMWFQSHSTCPLCRNPVSDQSSSLTSTNHAVDSTTMVQEAAALTAAESLNFPTNVLFWGDETQVNTTTCLEDLEEGGPSSSSSSSLPSSSHGGPEGMLVIDIPRHPDEEVHEEQKPPLPKRLRSFKRLLSRDRRLSPRTAAAAATDDLEQQRGA